MLDRFRSTDERTGCACEVTPTDSTLRIDASDCPAGGDLLEGPACRRTAVRALGHHSLTRVRVANGGLVRWYDDEATRLLSAAGRFAARIEDRDEELAARARSEPLDAATEAVSRAGLVAEVAEQTGLSEYAVAASGSNSGTSDGHAREGKERPRALEAALRPLEGPSIAASRIDPTPPSDGRLRTTRVTESGATVRIYDRDGGVPHYHVEPIEFTVGSDAAATLAQAAEYMIGDDVTDGRSALGAVRRAAAPDEPVDTLARILEKHTTGHGVLEDLFSDPALSEVFANAPVEETPLHVRTAEGGEMRTNVHLTERGAARFAAALRAASGRAFSRAAPTLDTALTDVGSACSVRVSAVRPPASDGLAFALRAEGTDRWRLSTLVENGTLSASAAGLLSGAMARGAAILIAGPRGAGKTTTASALLWELAPGTRILAIEDTSELPIEALQEAGRDAQRLEAASGFEAEIDPAEALHTALRFGDGALAVGEVRGEEAGVLYEAMRVGAASDTVIGTIHGEGYAGVKERVVSDLGVPASSFGATDLLVTQSPTPAGKRVTRIEEVTADGAATLFEYDDGTLQQTSRIERGNSTLVAELTAPDMTYRDTLAAIGDRAAALEPSAIAASESAATGGGAPSGHGQRSESSGRAESAGLCSGDSPSART